MNGCFDIGPLLTRAMLAAGVVSSQLEVTKDGVYLWLIDAEGHVCCIEMGTDDAWAADRVMSAGAFC